MLIMLLRLCMPGRKLKVLLKLLCSVSMRMGWDANEIHLQVLGNRSLKLKYLNSNTMFLATGSTPEQPGKAHVTAHIFDTITGRLLFSQTHEVGILQFSGACTWKK